MVGKEVVTATRYRAEASLRGVRANVSPLLSPTDDSMQECFSGNRCSRKAKVNPMAPPHRVGRSGIAQCSRGIGMTRLGLHVCYCRACV